MNSDASGTSRDHAELWRSVAVRSEYYTCRGLIIAVGICWSVSFVVVGLRYELQLYGDGSIFSYAIAVQDAWAFHWHNISGRLFVFLFSHMPAETYVELTGDAHGGVVVYGLLFFAAQSLGLAATFAADRFKGRIIFSYACYSTACLCPLVFGSPTEVWMSHALFWPTLAGCHRIRHGVRGAAVIFGMMLALVLTHDGALIFAIAILMTLFLRGMRDAAFVRSLIIFFLAMLIWGVIKKTYPPDPYMAEVMSRAAMHVFDINILFGDLMLLLFSTLAIYAIAFYAIHRLNPQQAHIYAVGVTTVTLITYWLWLDHALHTDNRYYLRTVLLLATPTFGAAAAVHALAAEGRLGPPTAIMPGLVSAFTNDATTARAVTGALVLVTLVHAVETEKFVAAWTQYKIAVRTLAIGRASDQVLGDPRFVSSNQINAALNRLSWFSTTQYLSVLVAPKLSPVRLVVDPSSNFFWLSCKTATENFKADRAVPAESRRLVQRDACLHRDP